MSFPYDIFDSFLMFFIYAFIGWIIEVIYYGITEGKFVNRGFLNGPLCPVYGIGFYAVILCLLPIQDNFVALFFGSMAITTVIEFLAGFILYRIFKLRWWDYSKYKLNIGGFICLQFSIYWGVACTLAMKILHPTVLYILEKVPFVVKIVVLTILISILVFDIVSTVITIIGFKKKLALLTNVSKEIRNVSDKLGEQIYGGVDKVVTRTAPAVETYGEYRQLYNTHRVEEKALMKQHRQEEREILEKLVSQEKLNFKNTKQNANDKLDKMAHGLRRREQHLLYKLSTGKNDAYRLVISVLKGEEDQDK